MSKPLKLMKVYFTTDDLAQKLGINPNSLFFTDANTNGQFVEYTVVIDNSVESDKLNENNGLGAENIRRTKFDF